MLIKLLNVVVVVVVMVVVVGESLHAAISPHTLSMRRQFCLVIVARIL